MNLLCGLSGIAGIKNPKKGLCNIFEAGYENILLDLSLCCTSGELEWIGKENIDTEKSGRLEVFENPEKMNEAFRAVQSSENTYASSIRPLSAKGYKAYGFE